MVNQRTGDDDMPGYRTGPAFKNESRDRGWTPYDAGPGLALQNHVVAAPPGWYRLYLLNGAIIRSPILAWEVYDDGQIEWHTLIAMPAGISDDAFQLPDGSVMQRTLYFPEEGEPQQLVWPNAREWASWCIGR